MKSSRIFILRLLALLFVSALLNAALMHPANGAIRLDPVLQGLASPLYVTNADDGSNRLFVVEQGGQIRALAADRTTLTLFLDISSRVLSGGERGLLGLAFHPQFATNSRFFVYYTRQGDGAIVIAEYQALATPAATAASEIILLTISHPSQANHNGGMIEFGPDGYLYVGTGDGGSANDPPNNAQNINVLLGKILRIDVDQSAGGLPYSSPPSNPFFGATPGADEIFAVGMRNPFRFSFDRGGTHQLYVGDVGQGAWEEVDIVTVGGNYGWRVYEGNQHCTGNDPGLCTPTNYVAPVAEYGHTGGRCSITGGYVYRGSAAALPAGTYVFGDYCTGEIFSMVSGAPSLLLDTTLNISSFGEDEAGELYVVGLGGTVHRIASTATTTTLTSAPNLALVGTSVTFTATVSGANPTGSVTFTENGNAICAAGTLSGAPRTASCSTSSLAVGVHSIVANYAGDVGNAPSSSTPLSQVITGVAGAFTNGGFEAPNLAGAYQYVPAGATWVFTGDAGITGNANGFTSGNPPAPEGVQVAFLERTGQATQTANIAAGTYTLSIRAAQRGNYQLGTQVVQLQVDGVTVGQYQPPTTSYTNYQTSVFTIATSGNHTLTLAGVGAGADYTAFVDDVRLTPTGVAGAFTNGGFEAPNLAGAYQYVPAGATWVFTGDAGITGNANGFTSGNPPAPEGVQVAFLERTGQATQTANIAAGTYTLSIRAAQRGNYQLGTQVVQLQVDGVTVGQYQPPTTSYTNYQTSVFTIATSGNHTLTLAGVGAGADYTAFVDDVRLTPTGVTATTTTLTSSGSPAPLGTPVTFTATVSGANPTGSVSFTEGGNPICAAGTLSGSPRTASCSTSSLVVGTHSIVANYGGDGNYAPSSSTPLSQVITGVAGAFTNGGFEAPNLAGAYQYVPAGATWVFTGDAGITGNANGFTSGNPPAPEGVQVAFLERTGQATQTANIAAGTYTLSIRAAQRGNYQLGTQVVQLQVDGVTVGQYQPPTTSYTNYQTSVFTIATSGNHTLTLAGVGAGADYTAFVDDVRLTPTGVAGAFTNGGFEAPNLAGAYQYVPAGATWVFTGDAGITGNANGFTSGNPPAPEGVQVAFLERTGQATQTANIAAGTYTLSIRAAQRGNYQLGTQVVQLQVDGVTVGQYQPPTTSYTNYQTSVFTIATSGNHTLTLAGVGAGADYTAFVDDVRLTSTVVVTYVLSGTVSADTALSGVTFAAPGGGNCTVSDAQGHYSCTVPQDWSGSVTPSLSGYAFTPASRSYSSVAANQTGQDYAASAIVGGPAPWNTFGRDAQHTALSATASQPLNQVHWQTPMDLQPQYTGTSLLIHYGSPLVTSANTVIVPVKTGAAGGFRIEARGGTDGALKWSMTTDYILPPASWIPAFGPALTSQPRLYFPGAGGTVYFRDQPDAVSGASGQIAFYGLSNYQANPQAYNSSVIINTPLTTDPAGNVYFGVQVTGSNPLGMSSGIVRIGADGVGTATSVITASGDFNMTKVPHNSAPALSADLGTLYVAVSDGSFGYLVALDSTTLAPLGRVRLKDPSSGLDARLSDNGSASPTVGTDGDVYFGVLENPSGSNHSRGWLLHFNSNLSQSKTPGAFGWDDTVSLVPAQMVPSYQGTSAYLLMAKYNNYAGRGGDGQNKLAVLDPNATQTDPVTLATVMKEVLTIVGPTPDPNAGGVREWCINSAAVDPLTKSILANNEDGKLYRWDLTTNTLSQTVVLTAGIGEAYTTTVIGVDGHVYAINNAILFAVGQ